MLALGTPSQADHPNPGTGQGNGKHRQTCKPRSCEPCYTLVDATPDKENDCVFACEPIPGCVP